ncbi:hypothetical protein QQ045_010407 [Rhodiola kirilowii]
MEDEVHSLARQFNGKAAISIQKVFRKEAEKSFVHALALKFCCMKGVNKDVVAPLLGQVRALQELIRVHRPLVVGLVESKSDSSRCEKVRVKLGFDCCFAVPARGRSGGLVLFWNNMTDVSVVSYSGFHIDCTLNNKGPVHVTIFYGNPRTSLRHVSWNLIRKLRELINQPWCIIGDFNEICYYSESSSRNRSRHVYMEHFRDVLRECGLVDLGFKGTKFTYSNKRQGCEEVRSCVDRAVGDDLWLNKFPNASVEHLVSHHSDHCPLLFKLDGISGGQNKLFRFESMWMRDASLADIISKTWNPSVDSASMNDKLAFLSQNLKIWNIKCFGNVNSQLKRLNGELDAVRQGLRSHETIDNEKRIAKEIDEWLVREEFMWAQRSRVSWLGEGDNNTKFFHQKANSRKRLNTISLLVDKEGVSQTEPNALEHVAVSYFKDIFSSTVALSDMEIQESLQVIPPTITDVQNRRLSEPRDFISSCFAILHEGQIPVGTNDTLIVLFPKTKSAGKMEDYRPISLTSVVSKTVAKAIVNRLQQILPEVICPAQSAFIKGRLITDNYLIAHESAHFIKNTRQGKSVYGSLKLDLSKAYDRVEWRFLQLLMLRFGFEARWVNMILSYVSSVRYAVRLNGKVSNFFAPGRGLRQGDPLSPYLFILCTEWLSYNLSKLEMDRSIEGIRVCSRAPFVSHLMFADDCLLLFKAKDGTAEALSSLLSKYESISGQVINYNKSELVLSPNSSEELRNHFGSQLSVSIVSHHAKYLGLPLSLQRKLSLNFSSLIDKFWNKSEGWVSKKLSAGGKEILIKTVLQALPQYAMNCFLLPVQVINKMHSSIKKLWWSSSYAKKPIYWVNSQTLCKEKNQGGLGFKDLQCINMAFLAKQAWRIYTKPELLVSKIFKAKYCPDYDMLNCSVGYRPSFCWRSIVKGFELVRAGSQHDHNGTIYWSENSSSELDIRSAYSLIRHIKTFNIGEDIGCSDRSKSQKFWAEFWKLEVPRKIKIFGWRGYHGALPTGISLHKRGMDINIGCGECGYHIETYSHVFLHCWFARAVWFQVGIPELCELPSSVVFADIIHYCWSYFSQKRRQLVLVTLWMIWFKRNKRKHEDIYDTFLALNLVGKNHLLVFLKVNSDAAWKDSEGGGIGIIVRDNEGITIAVRSIKAVITHNSVSCEGLGLLESFKLAEKLGADKVIFESDCADVVKWLNICPDDNIAHEEWFTKSLQILHRHLEWKVFLIRREANVVTDQLAKRAMEFNWCWTRLDCCPRMSFLSS